MDLVRIAAGIAVLLTSVAAAAEAPRDEDPNRQICKSKPVVGSRLKRIRECATAQEWEEMELQERLGLMRKQINGDPGCNNGGPVCHPEMRGGKDTPW